MRKSFIISLFVVFMTCGALYAQKTDFTYSDLKVSMVNDYVDVSFAANIANSAAKSSYTLFLVPTLTNGVTRQQLAPIVVQGKRAQVAEQRYTLAKSYPGLGQPVYATNGQHLTYHIAVPWQSWMSNNVQLVMEKYSRGCCSDVVLPSDYLAQNLVLGYSEEAPKVEAIAEAVPPEPVKPAEPVRAAEPVKPAEPAPVVVAEPVKPAEPVKAAEPPVKPAEPAPVVVEPVKVVEPIKVVEPVRVVDSGGSPIVVEVNVHPTIYPNQPQQEAAAPKQPSQKDGFEYDLSRLSAGDRLANEFYFVAPISQLDAFKRKVYTNALFDYEMPLYLGRGVNYSQQTEIDRYIEENRDNALSIYYRQGSFNVQREFASNGIALVDLISSIQMIQNAPDCRVVRIIISGFASPEGSFDYNDRLAHERAVTLKQIILNNTNVRNNLVTIYNGSVDWRGLYKLVAESDMYHKYQVLDILNFSPTWGDDRHPGRLDQLKRINNGEPYQYMMRHIFPLLRQAAYVKVYYENIPQPVVVQQQPIQQQPVPVQPQTVQQQRVVVYPNNP